MAQVIAPVVLAQRWRAGPQLRTPPLAAGPRNYRIDTASDE